ncbi:bifunctional homocysteine S-methyltransferase/methylenetetrahydrofolate reductase, partial [bacterium]|nr:bifunctional homocysteine S-methyltransferase/methylenetetrahydrofolate reductase [bacterium]
EIIETNTYTANRYRLESYGLDNKVREINLAAVKIAREASGGRAYVAGAVGPIGKPLEPITKILYKHAKESFLEQISVLVEGGVDVIMLETFTDLKELETAIKAAREVSGLPLIAQKTFGEDGTKLEGELPIHVVEFLQNLNVDVLGSNCTVGPQRMLDIIKKIAPRSETRLSVQPTAGLPQIIDNKLIYQASPEYFADYAVRFADEGVFLIGGCCGTTPAHIKAVSDRIKGMKPVERKVVITVKEDIPKPAEEIKAAREFSNFHKKIKNGEFVITTELDIPRGLDISEIIKGAEYLKEIGIDAANISDGARARLRMSPISVAHIIKSKVEIEIILHFTCRDRNLLGLQSELLGAYALGLKNILAITGDPATIGHYPNATSVFDVDSIGLVKILNKMNGGFDLGDNSIGELGRFSICVAGNPTAEDLDYELNRLKRKIDEGADVIFTQPVFYSKQIEQFLEKIQTFKVPLIVGILPLRSSRHAEFLHNEIPGIDIPGEMRKRMREVPKDGAMKEG